MADLSPRLANDLARLRISNERGSNHSVMTWPLCVHTTACVCYKCYFERVEQERYALKKELDGANIREAMLRDYIAGLEARLATTITTSNTTTP